MQSAIRKTRTIYKQNFKLKSNQLLTELEPLINEEITVWF
jgi:hypothetical protein